MNLVFVGNCHAQALTYTFRRANEYLGYESIEYIVSYETIHSRARAIIERADLIIEQVQDLRAKLDITQLSSRAKRVQFPIVLGGFLWPFAGQAHPRISKLIGELPYGAQYGDSFLNTLVNEGAPEDEAFEQYLNFDIENTAHLSRRLELGLELQRRLDIITGWDTAANVEARYQHEHLFMSHGHPNLPILRYLADRICTLLNLTSSATKGVLSAITTRPFTGSEIPIHPKVCGLLGLEFVGPEHRYKYFVKGELSFKDYVFSYMRRQWNETLERALSAGRAGDLDEAITLMTEGLSHAPQSAVAYDQLARMLSRRSRVDGAIEAEAKAVQLDTFNPHFQRNLGCYLLRQRKVDEAVHELERAVELDVDDPSSHMWLAQALFTQGKHRDAKMAAIQALKLDPWLSGARRLLDDLLPKPV